MRADADYRAGCKACRSMRSVQSSQLWIDPTTYVYFCQHSHALTLSNKLITLAVNWKQGLHEFINNILQSGIVDIFVRQTLTTFACVEYLPRGPTIEFIPRICASCHLQPIDAKTPVSRRRSEELIFVDGSKGVTDTQNVVNARQIWSGRPTIYSLQRWKKRAGLTNMKLLPITARWPLGVHWLPTNRAIAETSASTSQ